MKRKVITITSKDLKIPKMEKTIEDEILERYMRIRVKKVSVTDIDIVKLLRKVNGSTIQKTAMDLKINYKTITDAYRRLEMAGVVKFIIKMLPTRDGRKKMETKLFSLTPKFIKVPI